MKKNNLRFECQQCGQCCADIGDYIFGPQNYGYNCFGEFVRNPKISIPVHYTEAALIYQCKEYIKCEFPRLIPLVVLYLRENPIGYIFYYQIEAAPDSSCWFFNKEDKKCSIYTDRPGICHFYPLMFNTVTPEKPIVLVDCKITKKYEDLYPKWDKEQMWAFFGEIYEVFISYILPWNVEYEQILKKYGDLFLDEIEVSPKRVAKYTLKNFHHFLKEDDDSF